ncbi:NADP-dependent oxidoreductase [Corynebacterium lactis]|uniref:Oxidoreductase n=1 Tax=Corynebacterium lactis RW2-5 TaxID=1408189 RepID=A0A0K2GZ90_9CORY|nr:NADP-dependent oxidoreductase [Corynebacterium lactis]ALA67003.1 oxidoreductase [Corynebacterium lactis RW2-5]
MPANTDNAYAMTIAEFGSADVLSKTPIEPAQPGSGEVLFKTTAIGANPLDYKMRDGSSGLSSSLILPCTLGREAAGVVLAVGEGVTEFSPGDHVFGMRSHSDIRGTYATHNVFPASGLVQVPEGMDDITAAGIALAGLTAQMAVEQQAKVSEGETVLIHGAGGGVGQLITQLCLAREAKVYASASARHHDKLTGFGAQHIDYTAENVFDAVRAESPDGIDVVIDAVYFDTFIPSLDILRPGGRIVVLPSLADLTPAKERGIEAQIPLISNVPSIVEDIATRICRGELKIHIGRTAPLTDVAEVHRTLEEGHADGKIVLTVD